MLFSIELFYSEKGYIDFAVSVRLQNSRIFCVGLSNECARSLNEMSGASVKTESGTGVRLARFAREEPRFRRFAPCDQRFREKTTVLQPTFRCEIVFE